LSTLQLINHAQIEMASPYSLHISPTHARVHSPMQIEQIARSIDRFGFLVPLIVDDAGIVASGVGRLEAAKLRKLDAIPIIRTKFVSEASRRAFALADDKLAEGSSWDFDRVATELQFLLDNDFDFTVTGFDFGDLDVGIPANPKEEPPVELPNVTDIAVSRHGDLWNIGPHRLYCGNARFADSYEILLGGEKAAQVIADGPYNVPANGHVTVSDKVARREFAEAHGEMSRAEFTSFQRTVFKHLVQHSMDGSIHHQFMDFRHMREILDAADGVYTELKQLAVWVKDNAGMGSFLRSQHELVFIFKAGRGKHINNIGLSGKGDRHRSNVWSYAGQNTFHKGRKDDLAVHPTIKNVAMVADAILDCSNRGDLILDPFSGSGTTLLAAHRTGRRGAAIEIDPLYVDAALRRLAAATGLTPMLSDGRTFDEVVAGRAAEGASND
jgi:hypothetical protein